MGQRKYQVLEIIFENVHVYFYIYLEGLFENGIYMYRCCLQNFLNISAD